MQSPLPASVSPLRLATRRGTPAGGGSNDTLLDGWHRRTRSPSGRHDRRNEERRRQRQHHARRRPRRATTRLGRLAPSTNSPAGKEFYKANVHPFMASKCGACHGTAGPGPAWLTSADAEKSYAQLFSGRLRGRSSRRASR